MSATLLFIGDWGHVLAAALFAALSIWTGRRFATQQTGKLLVAMVVLGVAVWFSAGADSLWLHASGAERVIRLCLLVVGGMAIYFATLFVLGFRVTDFRRRGAS